MLVQIVGATVCLLVIFCIVVGCTQGWTFVIHWIRENAEPVKIVLLVLGALYTTGAYLMEMKNNRVGNALSYYERSRSGLLHDKFQTIDLFWIRGSGSRFLENYRENTKSTNQDVLHQEHERWAELVKDLIKENKLEDVIMPVYKFYQDVVECTERGRCDQETACNLFADDIQNFRLTYRKFLEEWEELWGMNLRSRLKYFHWNCSRM